MVIFANEEILINWKYHFVPIINFLNYTVSVHKIVVKLVYVCVYIYVHIHI